MSSQLKEERLKNGSGQTQSGKQAGENTTSRARKSLKGVGYEEGKQALSPNDKKEDDEKRQAQLESYEAVLGKYLGPKLYELVTRSTTPDKLVKYGQKAADALVKLIGSQAKNLDKLDQGDKKAIDQFVKALGQYSQEQAAAYMKTEEGQKVLKAVSDYVAEHPKVVVGVMIAAAVAAVVANMSVPEIKAKVGIAEGFSAEIRAKVGKIRELALDTVALDLEYKKGKVQLKAGVEHDTDKDVTKGGLFAKYEHALDEYLQVSTTGEFQDSHLLTARLGLSGKYRSLGVDLGTTFTPDKGTAADVKLNYGNEERKVGASAQYDPTIDQLRIQLFGDTLAKWKHDTAKLHLEGGYQKDKRGEAATMGFKYTDKHLKAALDAAIGLSGTKKTTLGASVEGRSDKGYLYGGGMTWAPRDNKILNYYAMFGFEDPEKFRGFLVKYKHDAAREMPSDEFDAKVDYTFHQLLMRVQDKTVLEGGKLSYGEASAHAAYKVDKDIYLLGGVRQGYGPNRQFGTMPEVGVQVKKVPLLVGYDPNSKTWSLRIAIPFGR